MPYHKDIHLKVNLVNIGQLTEKFPASMLGSAILLMVSLYHDDYDTMEKLTPKGSQLIHPLIEKKWVVMNNKFLLELTDTGKAMVEFFLAKAPKISKPKELPANVAAVETWIDEWIKMWPLGVKTFGKPIRSNKKAILKKMQWFVGEYKYSKEVIMTATYSYLMDRHQHQWQFTKIATNFISHQDSTKTRNSDLADLCLAVLNNADQRIQASIKQL